MQSQLNYIAIIIGALLYYAGGALWYSQVLFGKQWMQLTGMTEEKMKNAKQGVWTSYATALVSALVISYAMARLGSYMNIRTLAGGLHLGFWSWFGFVLTTMATNSVFSGKSVRLLLIDAGYHLYGFLIIGVLIGLWH